MKAVALYDHKVPSFNVRTPAGHKARKDYPVKKGQVFPVVREFRIRGGAYAGGRGLELNTPDKRRLLVPMDAWALTLDDTDEARAQATCFAFTTDELPTNNPKVVETVSVAVCLPTPLASQREAERVAREACDLVDIPLKPVSMEDYYPSNVIDNKHGVGVFRKTRSFPK